MLVVCGSVSAWISENILRNKAFVGRPPLNLQIGELPLRDCARFWGNRAARTSAGDMLDVLSVTGGVPKYLELVDPRLSPAENLKALCFTPGGGAGGRIRRHLHGRVRRKADDQAADPGMPRKRFPRRERAGPCPGRGQQRASPRRAGGTGNGGIHRARRRHEPAFRHANAAVPLPDFGQLHEISPQIRRAEQGPDRQGPFPFRRSGAASRMAVDARTPVRESRAEQPRRTAAEARTGPDASAVRRAVPPRAHSRGEGCQIDLLLQTRRTVWVVEIKRRREIDADVVDEVAEKVRRLGCGRRASVRTALVYSGRLSPAVEAEGYFDAVVDAADLLSATNPGTDAATTK